MSSASQRPRDSKTPGNSVVIPSPSASLVLLAPLDNRTKDGYDYRVLLLKRNARSSTFTSAHVFPGGNVDPIDKDVDVWSELFPSFKQMSAEDQRMLTMKLCAVRETFEECGILLLEGSEAAKSRWAAVPEDQRRQWRTRVHDSGPAFVELLKMLEGESGSAENRVRPGLSALQYRGNWITPANMRRRFDTCFFISVLPSASPASHNATERPHQDIKGPQTHAQGASADNTEMISADWLTPHEAIVKTLAHTANLMQSASGSVPDPAQSEQNDSIVLVPPQFYLLAELIHCKSWRDLVETSSTGATLVRARRVAAFEPEIRSVLDTRGTRRPATVLVGDPEHSKTDEALGQPDDRHRTYVLLPPKPEAKAGEHQKPPPPPLGLTVMGVHRQGMSRILGPGWEDMKEGDVGESTDSVSAHL